MSKGIKIAFVIFNIILFATNFALVVYFPKFMLFGWCPSELAFWMISMLIAAIVWGLYFNKFYDTQVHVDARYKEMDKEEQK